MMDLIHGFKRIAWNWLTIPTDTPGTSFMQFITWIVLIGLFLWLMVKLFTGLIAILKIIIAQTRPIRQARQSTIEEVALNLYGPVPAGCTIFLGNLSTGELLTHDGFIEIEQERYLHPSELSDPENTLQIPAMSAEQATRILKKHIEKNGR